MMEKKFLETISEYGLLEPGDKVLVAVSGGADSTALLYLLSSCKKQLGITLHAAHLNHLIRKGDAELDVRFVQGLAQNLGLPVTVESFDVPAFARENRLGLEAAARQIRYAFLEKAASEVGAAKIAVGHTADDNVETFLMRLLRGAGLKGLCGIPVKRGRIVRPMIRIWRREIEGYIGGFKLVPRRDHTNYESKYMRNRVRLKLIPQLKIYNLNIKEIILQTVLLLTDDWQYLEAKAENALEGAQIFSGENELALDIEKLKKVEYPVLGHLIREAIERLKGDISDLSYAHVRDVLGRLDEREKWELHFPGGVFVAGGRGRLTFYREKPVEKKKSFYCTLAVPGEVEIEAVGKRLRCSILDAGEEGQSDSRTVFVDQAALGKNIIVRNRAEGDRFRPLGMKGTKKLQDFFVDEKVPAELRDSIPVVESKGEIVWVAGMRIDDRAKVGKNTRKVVKLELL